MSKPLKYLIVKGWKQKKTLLSKITMHNYLFILGVILLLFFFLLKGKNKHQKNILKGNKILKKLNSFEHPGQKINYLRKIDPFVFEELLLSAFKNKGFKIIRNDRYTGDGGIDGVVYDKENNKILIQAKRYSKYINKQHLQDFDEVVTEQKAKKGYFIHTGKSGEKTRNLAYYSNVELIGGNKLLKLIEYA